MEKIVPVVQLAINALFLVPEASRLRFVNWVFGEPSASSVAASTAAPEPEPTTSSPLRPPPRRL